jgi:hypothetical protein
MTRGLVTKLSATYRARTTDKTPIMILTEK